jgi:hypothetical protein
VRDVLIVLNPRRIDECLDSIRALDIDKLWVRNLSEPQIANRWPHILTRLHHYDRAFIVSDDTVVHQPALDLLRGLHDQGYPVVTGYCNLGQDDMRVNLCPLPTLDVTVHMTLEQVQLWSFATVPTSFTGFSLTGMTLEMWRRYPFQTMPEGWGADQRLCQRLAADQVPIVAHRSAFMWHVKERWSQMDADPRKRLLVGIEPPAIDLEPAGLKMAA